MTFDSVQENSSADTMPMLNRAVDHVPQPESCKNLQTTREPKFWTALIASAERRKSGSRLSPSPLSTVFEEESEDKSTSSPHQDADGNTVMQTIDPTLLALSPPPTTMTIEPKPPTATATSSLRALITRKKSSGPRVRSRTSFAKAEAGGEEARGPVSLLRPVDPRTIVDENDGTMDCEEFGAPLERTRSNDSGYHSCSNARVGYIK